MNNFKVILFFLLIFGLAVPSLDARENMENPDNPNPTPPPTASSRNDCNPSTSQIDLEVNNVRARLLGGGDMWWDLSDGRYVVPNVPLGEREVSSIFAASVWVGGFDDGGNLKIAAQTYRQTGNDFWPGPLDSDGETSQAECNKWDRHFSVSGKSIDDLIADYIADDDGDGNPDFVVNGDPATDLYLWPAKGNTRFADLAGFSLPLQDLAPFFDADGDGLYDPKKGDIPIIGVSGCDAADVSGSTYGDQMIYWIYNDKGNIHTETNGDQIGMEIQALAFGFSTDDVINDMTFYKYTMLNKASVPLNDTYIAMWVDPDLGCYSDDFVGCNIDVVDGRPRNLGIVYNGDAIDADCEGVNGYGADEVPMLGVDYFRGPKDENGAELGMSAFIYYNNDFTVNGNPEIAQDFYGYMSGFWKDGSPVEFGGTGYQQGTFATPYMFPSDPSAPSGATVWSECSENNAPADRRFVQASGPFRLEPGAFNEVIIGAVWIPKGEYPCPSFQPLLDADDIAQALFDNCFDIVDGPDAPEMEVVELDKELIINLRNVSGNNVGENYEEREPFAPPSSGDTTYKFQGYILYQLADATVSSSEYDDPEKAREVAIVDIKDGIGKIVNYVNYSDPEFFGFKVPVEKVDGPDQGVLHSFNITNDLFATGDSRLVNHKKYYFSTVAYAHNNFQTFDPVTNTGQDKNYIAGRRNIKVATAIPHITAVENNGTIVNAKYGDSPQITRIDGVGNSRNYLRLTQATEDEILANGFAPKLVYQENYGPFDVQVVNPLNVVDGNYELSMYDNDLTDTDLQDSIYYVLRDLSTGDTYASERTIDRYDERIIAELGISIGLSQVALPGNEPTEGNGYIGGASLYADDAEPWYGFVPEGAPGSLFNYLRTDALEADESKDPLQVYSNVIGGTWYPYSLMSWRVDPNAADGATGEIITPAWTDNFSAQVDARNKLQGATNVDVVYTSDKSKWTRCVVVNTFSRAYSGEGLPDGDPAAGVFGVRSAQSVDKEGNPDATGTTGYGWFPGYAIDVETGERLNVFFGENSLYNDNFADVSGISVSNGDDMIWNPTSDFFTPVQNPPQFSSFAELPLGGHHWVYVTNTAYDEGAVLHAQLSGGAFDRIGAWSSVIWTSLPVITPGMELLSVSDGLIPSDLRFEIRVNGQFDTFTGTGENDSYPRYQFGFTGTATVTDDVATAESALDDINVVPNPYLAFSSYENSQFDNIVKITNLPNECTITIYSLDGRMIRKYDRNEISPKGNIFDQVVTSVEWDLKNFKGIPISSGVYLIHVDAGSLGERVIKWFGTMRQFDTLGL